ncbi:hypothetical protein Sipo8835_33500 [Streptomyces ipomoeae]|uniref:Uncharacterized protein n=2 Tax=Streptomyces ipomoeae TaxID=103232 RepID=L1L643_9ACTN|nr:DUF6207 family protein [Streptomyces ipomoeae]EKX68083.1 hypothetical protein STRIP9103_00080 [Streptomyces ipomoeae 91-03]MDX2697414.1 DUF6207 family protein [Streptomyces ipomoeae]MDX2827899.1 DUF6207 family protein [Streptomyces ipomoeae]MDX2843186.1 DUF6207 family protein [Streptomyces ipomoeae]MDX2880250.1 DUF6207 family protein [Streptomyces ipomoeae]
MKTRLRRNSPWAPGRSAVHGPGPRDARERAGLLVVDVAAADATVLAFQQLLAARWATAAAEQTTRDAGQPGVRLRCYLDLCQPLDS